MPATISGTAGPSQRRDRGRDFFERVLQRCAELMQHIVAAQTGDRRRRGRRDRGRLPAGRELRSGDRRREARASRCPASTSVCSARRRWSRSGVTISRKHAMEMALTGELYRRAEAERFGLVNRVVPPGQALGAGAEDSPQSIATRSARDVGDGKQRVLPPDRGRSPTPTRSPRARWSTISSIPTPAKASPPFSKSARRLGGSVNHDSYPDPYIRDILSEVKTIAMVGASANVARPSYFVLKYLSARGYKVLPINPGSGGRRNSRLAGLRAGFPRRPAPSTWSTSFAIRRRRAPSSTRR